MSVPLVQVNVARCHVRRPLLKILWVALLLLSVPLSAQEQPSLRPVAVLLAEAQTDSVATMRYVARRCSGFFALVSNQYQRRRDAGTAEMYTTWSIGFEVAAARADIQLGSTAEEAVRNNELGISQIADRLRERMNRTRALGDDPLLSSDLRTCRRLVDELGLEGPPLLPE